MHHSGFFFLLASWLAGTERTYTQIADGSHWLVCSPNSNSNKVDAEPSYYSNDKEVESQVSLANRELHD